MQFYDFAVLAQDAATASDGDGVWGWLAAAAMAIAFVVEKVLSILKSKGVDLVQMAAQTDQVSQDAKDLKASSESMASTLAGIGSVKDDLTEVIRIVRARDKLDRPKVHTPPEIAVKLDEISSALQAIAAALEKRDQ